jgi:hypothetical protein
VVVIGGVFGGCFTEHRYAHKKPRKCKHGQHALGEITWTDRDNVTALRNTAP